MSCVTHSSFSTSFQKRMHPVDVHDIYVNKRSSAKLTNQHVSYAFTSSPLSFHARHILPTSKFQHSYSCILLIFYTTDISEQHMWELWVWIQSTGLTLPLQVTPMNNPITLITSTSVAGLHFCCRWQYMRSSANFRTVFSENHAERQPIG